MLGLPETVTACLFDVDGVLTQTATVHASAWKQMFNDFLRSRAANFGEQLGPFTAKDYDRYVDGKPRQDGTRSFLASRGIVLPEGSLSDSPHEETVWGLSNRKNVLLRDVLKRDGVAVFDGSVRFVRAARQAGLKTAVVSSSANAHEILRSAGIADLFQARIDGVVARQQHLAGKPAPDMFLAGAKALGVAPKHAAVFEDALAGVAAGRAGSFGIVIGVDRVGQADALRQHGADVVVKDLSELLEGA